MNVYRHYLAIQGYFSLIENNGFSEGEASQKAVEIFKIENDTVKEITIDKSNIEIKEDSIEKPYLIEYKGKFKKDWYNWFAIE